MPGLTATAAGSAWSYGGSILTFVFPILLFVIVAAVLWVLFTKPQVVPGHRDQTALRSVGTTWMVRPSGQTRPAGEGHAASDEDGGQARAAGGDQSSPAGGGPAPAAAGEGEGR